ncbi:MAG: hypothetical protein ACRDRT_18430, partial [Pseudonocardiaceae bacterium]
MGALIVFPPPVAVTATEAPATGFPPASRAVIVIVDAVPPAVICPSEAFTVDWLPLTGPDVTVTTELSVMFTPLMRAVMVCCPRLVEANVPVATPLEFV